jgi:hypothetical protein
MEKGVYSEGKSPEQLNKIRVYTKQVYDLMYSGDSHDKKYEFEEAVRKVIAGKEPIGDLRIWMSRISKYRKSRADLNELEKRAVSVPLGKKVASTPKPYVNPEDERNRKFAEDNPLFEKVDKNFEREMREKRAWDEFH